MDCCPSEGRSGSTIGRITYRPRVVVTSRKCPGSGCELAQAVSLDIKINQGGKAQVSAYLDIAKNFAALFRSFAHVSSWSNPGGQFGTRFATQLPVDPRWQSQLWSRQIANLYDRIRCAADDQIEKSIFIRG